MDIYLVIVLVLGVLAISDLIIGVSNDAVNFLNTAVGTKITTFKWILLVASLGVILGAVTSSGMMEVARKGIFHPGLFSFHEIILIFLAVMVTDILLLDGFNTLGMPTSTTVSIVFELLGAAVGMAVIKSFHQESDLSVMEYINSGKALFIISGILLSVVVAFTVGAVLQYISRVIFSFDYHKTPKWITILWAGVVMTSISYFVIVKGLKSATFLDSTTRMMFVSHPLKISVYLLGSWVVILGGLIYLTKINVFKIIILFGTFALAVAFSGNDLVNFIGVPLAGYASYLDFTSHGGVDAHSYLMEGLAGKVKTPIILLLLAGVIMMITLYLSSKAKAVVKTSLDLGRQGGGDERFGSSALSRAIVRFSVKTGQRINKVLPAPVSSFLSSRFDDSPFRKMVRKLKELAPEFDVIRGGVTLMVSSILISLATNMKLPLSTTYVTFMVAMGTSFADGAWGRESAVYRVSGVFAVVGGWFFTAFIAFTISFIMLNIFYFGGWIGVFGMLAIVIYVLYRTHLYHRQKQSENEEDQIVELVNINRQSLVDKGLSRIERVKTEMDKVIPSALQSLLTEDLNELQKVKKRFSSLNSRTKKWKDNLDQTISKMPEDTMDLAHYYVQILDYLRELTHSVSHIVIPSYKHVSNNHKPLKEDQINQLLQLANHTSDFFNQFIGMLQKKDFDDYAALLATQEELIKENSTLRKLQIKRIKKGDVGTRNSLLYFNILAEFKNLSIFGLNLFKSQRDMINAVDVDPSEVEISE